MKEEEEEEPKFTLSAHRPPETRPLSLLGDSGDPSLAMVADDLGATSYDLDLAATPGYLRSGETSLDPLSMDNAPYDGEDSDDDRVASGGIAASGSRSVLATSATTSRSGLLETIRNAGGSSGKGTLMHIDLFFHAYLVIRC